MRMTRKPSNLMEARMWRAYHERRRPSSAVVVHTKGPSLPAKTWLQVFDELARGGDYDAIAACADVCRVFAECSGRYIKESGFCRMLLFGDEGDVYRARKKFRSRGLMAWPRVNSVSIRGRGNTKAIPHIESFASFFATGNWVRIDEMTIEWASWPSLLRAPDAAVVKDFSCFARISNLILDHVTFPSIITFGALVSALPRLEMLILRDVKLSGSSFLFDPRTLSDFRLLPSPKNLQYIVLGAMPDDGDYVLNPSAWPYYTELLAFMAAVGNPCRGSPRVYPWGSVRVLRLDENIWWKFSSSSIARLLRALPSLELFDFATADRILADLEITGIDSTVYPCLQEADTLVTTAINELVQHAGPSLDDLGLILEGYRYGEYYPPDQHNSIYAYCQCDLFVNTNPTSFRIYGCDASCLGVREILSHVTSRCVSSLIICFKRLERSDRGALSEGLSRLDTVLLLPVFDNLVHVLISVEVPSTLLVEEMTEWAHSMKSCLARLHEQGMVGIELHDKDSQGRASHHVRLGLIWDDDIEHWRRYDSRMDQNGNVEIVEVPAFEGGAPSEAMAAYTTWRHRQEATGNQPQSQSSRHPPPRRWRTEVTARGRAYELEVRGVKGIIKNRGVRVMRRLFHDIDARLEFLPWRKPKARVASPPSAVDDGTHQFNAMQPDAHAFGVTARGGAYEVKARGINGVRGIGVKAVVHSQHISVASNAEGNIGCALFHFVSRILGVGDRVLAPDAPSIVRVRDVYARRPRIPLDHSRCRGALREPQHTGYIPVNLNRGWESVGTNRAWPEDQIFRPVADEPQGSHTECVLGISEKSSLDKDHDAGKRRHDPTSAFHLSFTRGLPRNVVQYLNASANREMSKVNVMSRQTRGARQRTCYHGATARRIDGTRPEVERGKPVAFPPVLNSNDGNPVMQSHKSAPLLFVEGHAVCLIQRLHEKNAKSPSFTPREALALPPLRANPDLIRLDRQLGDVTFPPIVTLSALVSAHDVPALRRPAPQIYSSIVVALAAWSDCLRLLLCVRIMPCLLPETRPHYFDISANANLQSIKLGTTPWSKRRPLFLSGTFWDTKDMAENTMMGTPTFLLYGGISLSKYEANTASPLSSTRELFSCDRHAVHAFRHRYVPAPGFYLISMAPAADSKCYITLDA
ncbi:predicted protein [Postia placenta Mad-698-R]|uniref:Uncharacterized protein n=1 Tax=Postia placenta MAD-698-R-SB12 TaxID=670580 RepID=A0A1X6N196_9APHY|nr:hypothetical protein POSPLADRAFT_1143848 [Postia placenta MAD-698-R-SB12]EED83316.1 predicted protein [Postia placenta Mad-698-R]OSX62399.1 hypothetical protein POSPLADRAFT_1143848 [Postia placenta MAD-698-R-SB12]